MELNYAIFKSTVIEEIPGNRPAKNFDRPQYLREQDNEKKVTLSQS